MRIINANAVRGRLFERNNIKYYMYRFRYNIFLCYKTILLNECMCSIMKAVSNNTGLYLVHNHTCLNYLLGDIIYLDYVFVLQYMSSWFCGRTVRLFQDYYVEAVQNQSDAAFVTMRSDTKGLDPTVLHSRSVKFYISILSERVKSCMHIN